MRLYIALPRKPPLLLLLLLTAEPVLAVAGRHGGKILRYNRDDLLLLWYVEYPAPNLDNCGELLRERARKAPRRKRGRRGGVRQTLKRHSPLLPSIMLTNVRSRRNKL